MLIKPLTKPFSRLILETFIARRLGGTSHRAKIMLRVATLCVAVSIAVMLVALGIVNGFRNEVTRKVTAFTADIQLTARGSGNSYEASPVDYDSLTVADIATVEGVSHVQRFAAKAGILRSDSTTQGVVLKGIGADADTTFLHEILIEGSIPVYSDTIRNRDVLISATLGRIIGLEIGDRFEVMFIGDDTPRRDRLRVAGIYDSGMEDFDKMTIIGDLAVVQRLNGWDAKQIGGYEVAVQRGSDHEQVANSIAKTIYPEATVFDGWGEATHRGDLEIETVMNRNPQIFDWLDMLGLNTSMLIIIMLIVSVVNMASGVLIVVLEQTRTIGILKALGMRNGVLQRIFVLRSVGITIRGLIWGNVVGLVICLVQQYAGVMSLDPQTYMMPTVPVWVDWTQVVMLNVGTFAVITLTMGLPTAIIARITPDKSIRFQ